MSTERSHQYSSSMKFYFDRIKQFTASRYNRSIELEFKYYSDYDGKRMIRIKLEEKTLLVNVVRLENLCITPQECIFLSASVYLYIYLYLMGFNVNDIKNICKQNFPELYTYLIKILSNIRTSPWPLTHL